MVSPPLVFYSCGNTDRTGLLPALAKPCILSIIQKGSAILFIISEPLPRYYPLKNSLAKFPSDIPNPGAPPMGFIPWKMSLVTPDNVRDLSSQIHIHGFRENASMPFDWLSPILQDKGLPLAKNIGYHTMKAMPKRQTAIGFGCPLQGSEPRPEVKVCQLRAVIIPYPLYSSKFLRR